LEFFRRVFGAARFVGTCDVMKISSFCAAELRRGFGADFWLVFWIFAPL
jgi:hypothetical protein